MMFEVVGLEGVLLNRHLDLDLKHNNVGNGALTGMQLSVVRKKLNVVADGRVASAGVAARRGHGKTRRG